MRIRLPLSLMSPPLTLAYRAWASTIRFVETRRDRFVDAQPAITCLWHDELFPCLLIKGETSQIALVSPSQDGDYLTAIMRGYAFRIVRGSSSRGSVGALHELISGIRDQGYGIGITVDGPTGPRHKAKPGALWLAAQTGRPIVPIRTYMSRAKRFNSWDRFQLPLPFSTMHTFYGEPWYPDIDPDSPASLRRACRELEARLNALTPESFHD